MNLRAHVTRKRANLMIHNQWTVRRSNSKRNLLAIISKLIPYPVQTNPAPIIWMYFKILIKTTYPTNSKLATKSRHPRTAILRRYKKMILWLSLPRPLNLFANQEIYRNSKVTNIDSSTLILYRATSMSIRRAKIRSILTKSRPTFRRSKCRGDPSDKDAFLTTSTT